MTPSVVLVEPVPGAEAHAEAKAEVVEATGNFHHEVSHAATVKANTVLDTSQALDPADGVFYSHPPSRLELVRRLLLIGQAAAARLLERLLYFDPFHSEGQKAEILEQDAAVG